ncbi:hypothetical protein LXL04_017670 [Taraxacum kok-saghyz]
MDSRCSKRLKFSKTVAAHRGESEATDHSVATRWQHWTSQKINILIWKVCRNRMPTRDYLVKMGVISRTRYDIRNGDKGLVAGSELPYVFTRLLWDRVGLCWDVEFPKVDSSEKDIHDASKEIAG